LAEQYIYEAQTESIFYEKLENFHDKYVYHLLLNGLAEKGVDLESIKMTKNPDVGKKYCQRVVGGLTKVKPEVIVSLVEDGHLRLQCIFTFLNDNEYAKNELFMIQNVMDWPQLGKYSCQIWYLGQSSVSVIKDHWK